MKNISLPSLLCLVFFLPVLDAHVIVTPRESTAGAEQVHSERAERKSTVNSTTPSIRDSGRHACDAGRAGDGSTFDVKKDGRSDRLDGLEARNQAEEARALHLHRA